MDWVCAEAAKVARRARVLMDRNVVGLMLPFSGGESEFKS